MCCRASTLSSAVNSLSSTGISFSRMDEKEKQQALEEEQARLQALKVTSPLFSQTSLKPAADTLFPPLLIEAALGSDRRSYRIHEGFVFVWVHFSPFGSETCSGCYHPRSVSLFSGILHPRTKAKSRAVEKSSVKRVDISRSGPGESRLTAFCN